jgi:dienelactone hydrolase
MKHTIPLLTALLLAPLVALHAADSLTPYTADNVPQNVVDLWKDFDARKDALETKVVKEWREDGAVCRYVIFKVGTFKGADSRIAAFYSFPERAKKAPAFVWAHGGGQRADRERGLYFAKQGYATVDINWGGREMVEGITENTDWGNVDPSQGPQFYPKAFRGGKSNLLPDEHTIDSVVSPRNGNWFLLTYAGRRAITFLEQQQEVDPEKIGFTGFSMGGNITSYVAIDSRLKAVVPMVGGTGFISSEFPGIAHNRPSAAPYSGHVELFANTMESQSYYPHVKVPVPVLTASDDFHGIVDRAYTCMDLLPHKDWRVSLKMHYSHNLGAEQWIMINQWFDKYLKGEPINIPKTAESSLALKPETHAAVFTVKPDQPGQLKALDIYYSYDPNPQSRFWKLASSVQHEGDTWSANLPLHSGLPLFVFANCTYPLGTERESFDGRTSTYTITSREQVHLPTEWKLENLKTLAASDELLPSFERGWGDSPIGGVITYKFRDPEMRLPGKDRALRLTLTGVTESYGVRFRITKNHYLTDVKAPPQDYVANVLIKPGDTKVVVGLADFLDSKKQTMPDWSNVSTLRLDFIQKRQSIPLKGNPMLQSLEWTAAKAEK